MPPTQHLADRINANIPLISVVFIIISTFISLIFIVFYLGIRHVGFIIFISNSDILRVFINTLPFLFMTILLATVAGLLAERVTKSETKVIQHIGNNFIPTFFLLTPPVLIILIYRIYYKTLTIDIFISAGYLFIICFLTLLISVGIIDSRIDPKTPPPIKLVLCVIILIPLYAVGGLFMSSLQNTPLLPCYNVTTKEDIPNHNGLKKQD